MQLDFSHWWFNHAHTHTSKVGKFFKIFEIVQETESNMSSNKSRNYPKDLVKKWGNWSFLHFLLLVLSLIEPNAWKLFFGFYFKNVEIQIKNYSFNFTLSLKFLNNSSFKWNIPQEYIFKNQYYVRFSLSVELIAPKFQVWRHAYGWQIW